MASDKGDDKHAEPTVMHFQIWGDVAMLSDADLNAGLKYWRSKVGKTQNEHVVAERIASFEREKQARRSEAEPEREESLAKRIDLLTAEIEALEIRLNALEQKFRHRPTN